METKITDVCDNLEKKISESFSQMTQKSLDVQRQVDTKVLLMDD